MKYTKSYNVEESLDRLLKSEADDKDISKSELVNRLFKKHFGDVDVKDRIAEIDDKIESKQEEIEELKEDKECLR